MQRAWQVWCLPKVSISETKTYNDQESQIMNECVWRWSRILLGKKHISIYIYISKAHVCLVRNGTSANRQVCKFDLNSLDAKYAKHTLYHINVNIQWNEQWRIDTTNVALNIWNQLLFYSIVSHKCKYTMKSTMRIDDKRSIKYMN